MMTMSGNDFRLYAGVDFSSEFLAHYGVGHLDGGNSGRYKWGSGKNPKQREGSGKRVFVSGSSKTQDKNNGRKSNPYYRKKLPKAVRSKLNEKIRNGDTILVGDAPGIDRQVQDYLLDQKYDNVEVYAPGKSARYLANQNWKVNAIDDPDHEPNSREWLAKKDVAMSDAADEGLAIVLDEGSKATKRNVERLLSSGKKVDVYQLRGTPEARLIPSMFDKWLDENGKTDIRYFVDKEKIADKYQNQRKELATRYLEEIASNALTATLRTQASSEYAKQYPIEALLTIAGTFSSPVAQKAYDKYEKANDSLYEEHHKELVKLHEKYNKKFS